MPLTTRPASTSRQAIMRLARHGLPGKPGFGLLGWSGSEGTEVLQDLKTALRGFFRMELHAKNVVTFNRGGESAAILRARHRLSHHRRAKRMCVIDESSALDPAQQA